MVAHRPLAGVAGVDVHAPWRRSAYSLGAARLEAADALAKRCMDIIGALVVLVITAPVMALLALLVKLDSPGPVFFPQTRVGLGGRPFRMLKLRTMRLGADDEKASMAHLNASSDQRLFKIPEDPRVTRLGAIIRRWSLDELPQLFNVLVGDMSLVGPRPFFESDLDDYEAHHFHRLAVKPGLTGLWQVSGRSDIVDFEEVVRLDRYYIEQWSLALDLRILARTLPTVVMRRGAY
jgi:exopolysaccharide biosynthesis polyprenyl glycosylphosphotransferase